MPCLLLENRSEFLQRLRESTGTHDADLGGLRPGCNNAQQRKSCQDQTQRPFHARIHLVSPLSPLLVAALPLKPSSLDKVRHGLLHLRKNLPAAMRRIAHCRLRSVKAVSPRSGGNRHSHSNCHHRFRSVRIAARPASGSSGHRGCHPGSCRAGLHPPGASGPACLRKERSG